MTRAMGTAKLTTWDHVANMLVRLLVATAIIGVVELRLRSLGVVLACLVGVGFVVAVHRCPWPPADR